MIWSMARRLASPGPAGSDSHDLPTNAAFFNLAPSLVISPLSAAAGEVVLTVECTPRLRPEQEKLTFLFFGSRQLIAESIVTPVDQNKPTTLTFHFQVPIAEAGLAYTVRLRVDGVDSQPFAAPGPSGNAAALIFDPQQQVTIP
jgi:hypothetical protein